nr:Rnase Y domain-containing protein [Candidatus Wallbacteria bacterium]
MEVSQIDNPVILNLVWLLVGALTGAVIVFLSKKFYTDSKINATNLKIQEMLKKAKDDAEGLLKEAHLEAKEQLVELKKELEKRFQKETREKRDELLKYEQRINAKEAKNDKKADTLEKREKVITEKEQEIEVLKAETESLKKQQVERLEQISGLSMNEARNHILNTIEMELQGEIAKKVKKAEDEAKETADRKAKWIIATAVGRCAIDHNIDSMVTVV